MKNSGQKMPLGLVGFIIGFFVAAFVLILFFSTTFNMLGDIFAFVVTRIGCSLDRFDHMTSAECSQMRTLLTPWLGFFLRLIYVMAGGLVGFLGRRDVNMSGVQPTENLDGSTIANMQGWVGIVIWVGCYTIVTSLLLFFISMNMAIVGRPQ